MKGNVYHVYVPTSSELIETADVMLNEQILYDVDIVRVNLKSPAATSESVEEHQISDYSEYIMWISMTQTLPHLSTVTDTELSLSKQ